MQQRTIGQQTVSAIGLGGMPMSIEGRPDRARSIAAVHASLDAGVTLIDTADAYHLGPDDVGHNEELVAEALARWGGDTSDVLVATKGGHLRPGDGEWTLDGSPEHLRVACDASLKRLGVEAIGLYQFHRPDPKVPYLESVGALGELLDAGKIRMAGISNADPDQIARRRTSWAAGWCRSRTSTRRRSGAACPSCGCARRWAWPSCPGARWAASGRRPTWAPTTPSRPWRPPTASARSR